MRLKAQLTAMLLCALMPVSLGGCSAMQPPSPTARATDAAQRYVTALISGDAATVDQMSLVTWEGLPTGLRYKAGHGSLLQQVQLRAFDAFEPGLVKVGRVAQATWQQTDDLSGATTTYTARNGDQFFSVEVDTTWSGSPPIVLDFNVGGVLRQDESIRITDVEPQD